MNSSRLEIRTHSVPQLLRTQAEWCERLGSPMYSYLLELCSRDFEERGPVAALLESHKTDPPKTALALRFMGAVHRLVLINRAPELGVFYPSAGGDRDFRDCWPQFLRTVEQHSDRLREWINHPVQTNEIGRCGALLGGFLLISKLTSLPLRLLEIGASAGLNLRWDKYRYEAAIGHWGDPSSAVCIRDVFVEGKPPLYQAINVAERAGCDHHPINITSEDEQITLLSYIWADQRHRIDRSRKALEIAAEVPCTIDRQSAGSWLEAMLDRSASGVTTVIFHSIVWQYIPEEEQRQIRRLIYEAGKKASPQSPLAWLRMEPGGKEAEVRLTLFPDGIDTIIAYAGYHGGSVHWIGSE